MNTYVAICTAVAILLGLPFIGLVIYKRGAARLFGLPRSRFAAAMMGSIIFAYLVVSLGVLTLGGWWFHLMPWCGLLLELYLWIRGAYLLLHPPKEPTCDSSGTASTA